MMALLTWIIFFNARQASHVRAFKKQSLRFLFAPEDGCRQAACLLSGSLIKARISSWEVVGTFFFFFLNSDPFLLAQAVWKLLNIVRLTVKPTRAGNPAAGGMLSGASAKERVLDYFVGAWGLRSINLQVLVGGHSYLLCIWYPLSITKFKLPGTEASYHFPTAHSTACTAQRPHTGYVSVGWQEGSKNNHTSS